MGLMACSRYLSSASKLLAATVALAVTVRRLEIATLMARVRLSSNGRRGPDLAWRSPWLAGATRLKASCRIPTPAIRVIMLAGSTEKAGCDGG